MFERVFGEPAETIASAVADNTAGSAATRTTTPPGPGRASRAWDLMEAPERRWSPSGGEASAGSGVTSHGTLCDGDMAPSPSCAATVAAVSAQEGESGAWKTRAVVDA